MFSNSTKAHYKYEINEFTNFERFQNSLSPRSMRVSTFLPTRFYGIKMADAKFAEFSEAINLSVRSRKRKKQPEK